MIRLTVVNMGCRAHHTTEHLLPSDIMKAFKTTQEECANPSMTKLVTNKKDTPKQKTMIWPSAAASYDYASSAHDDNDFSLSMLNVVTSEGTDKRKYILNQPIATYFVFPELGISVGLCHGDQLLFNPQFYHCVSTKCTLKYRNKIHITSFYLKTAIAGGNKKYL